MKFIKTEAGALINSDYIRVVYPDTKLHPVVLIAELDNGDQYHLAEFKDALGYFALRAMNGREPFKSAIKLSANFFKPRSRKSKFLRGGINFAINPDFGGVDNLVKTVMDSLNGICYIDDRQVIEIYARKFFGKPHIEISLEELK